MENTSVWDLKKKPLKEVAGYIMRQSPVSLQARMAGLSSAEYRTLSKQDAEDRIITGISRMDDETYTDCLLDLIDE